MKAKFLLIGIGIGIIITALVLFVTFKTGGYVKESEAATTQQSADNKATTESTTEIADKETTTEKTTETTTEETTTETTTEETTTEKTTETTTEETTTEKTTETTTEETTTKETTETTTEETTETTTEKTTEDDKPGTIKITVKPGMSSEDVARLLADAGVVDDAVKFDSFLCSKGYDMKINVGDFTFKKNMSYEEAARVLIK